MAVTVEGTSTTGTAVVASSITFSKTVGATATGLFVGAGNTYAATNTATFNGDSLTELWDANDTVAEQRASGYLMVTPDITTGNVVVTWAASCTGNAGAVSLAGLETASVAAAHRTVYVADDLGSAPTVTVADSVSADLVIDSAATFNATITVGTGQTSRCEDDAIAGGSTSWGVSTESATGANTVMSWTGGSFACTGATALIAAAAGGRTTKNTRAAPLGMNIGMDWRSGP